MDKNYDHVLVENGLERFWIDNDYFKCGKDKKALKKKPFSLIVPPPNVTGKLHIGHAKDTTEQDIIARYKRLKGFDVLYLPAMDHAGIATQAKVEEKMRKEGIDKYKVGREGFLKKAWEWKEEYSSNIQKQWEAMGLSMDYSKQRFTLDDGMQKAVAHVFKTLYDEGLIYQGERIINWDPELRTALSNIEVIHKDIPGKFYYFKYHLKSNPSIYLTIATTRPETMFGDTALVFNPSDERFKKYENEIFINPANGKELPLIADRYVDKSFGTGCMKCTPAHDPNDFQIALRHDLKMPVIMDTSAHMNELCGKYEGQDRFECRESLVKDIDSRGDLIKIENITHNVGHSERTGCIIEPYLCKQWFVKMKPLSEAVDAIQHSKDRTKFYPHRFSKIFQRWLDTTEDWCISRQLWWGHRIPVYTNKVTNEVICSEEPLDPSIWEQDPDVLDTWFSSGLAPFAFLGWPNDLTLIQRYYPLDVMVTAYDILFFWVARMAFDGVHFTKKMPFKNVVLHGLIRDSQGRKMSKSLGNGIDPFDVINKYGCDSMRWALCSQGAPGLDLNIGEDNFKLAQEFINKVWNASRFVLSQIPSDFNEIKVKKSNFTFIENWVYKKLNFTIHGYSKAMDRYEQGQASKYLTDFIYNDFCSNYLEWIKVDVQQGRNKDEVYSILLDLLKKILLMLFPFCPFISEYLYNKFPNHKKSLFDESFPKRINIDENKALLGDKLNDIITYIRNFKSSNNFAPNEPIDVKVYCSNEEFNLLKPYIVRFGFVKDIELVNKEIENMRFFDKTGILISVLDSNLLSQKLNERIEKLKFEIERSKKMLANENFINRANPKVVEAERIKLENNLLELSKYLNK